MLELMYPDGTAPFVPAKESLGGHSLSEILPIVEPSGEVIGRALREYCHGGSKVLHPVVHLHIIRRDGSLYLQKRSLKKDLLPGYWDTAVGGHVTYGESVIETLYRESQEELGMMEFHPMWLQSYIWESDAERELVSVFATVGNFSPVPDGDEVEEGRFWDMNEIEKCLSDSLFTPNFESEFVRIRKPLEALL